MSPARILVACIGNIFLGDDAFGVEVAQRLVQRPWPDDVRVVDFGIRGLDLVCALLNCHENVILVDAIPRGGSPGTLYVMEPDRSELASAESAGLMIETHNLDPVKVLRLATAMGARIERLLLVGCEPTPLAHVDDMQMGLSDPVRAAVGEAVALIESLVARLVAGEPLEVKHSTAIPEKEVGKCRE
jgi:hydrogenase maturation protease